MKTTLKNSNVPIVSMQKFNRTDVVTSLTIGGVESLADIDVDKYGNTILLLKRDNTKIDKVVSNSPLITVNKSTTTLTLDINETMLKTLIKSEVEKVLTERGL